MSSPFTVHILNKEGLRKAAEIQRICETAHRKLAGLCNDDGYAFCRATEHLQIASFLVKRDMAEDPYNQDTRAMARRKPGSA